MIQSISKRSQRRWYCSVGHASEHCSVCGLQIINRVSTQHRSHPGHAKPCNLYTRHASQTPPPTGAIIWPPCCHSQQRSRGVNGSWRLNTAFTHGGGHCKSGMGHADRAVCEEACTNHCPCCPCWVDFRIQRMSVQHLFPAPNSL